MEYVTRVGKVCTLIRSKICTNSMDKVRNETWTSIYTLKLEKRLHGVHISLICV